MPHDEFETETHPRLDVGFARQQFPAFQEAEVGDWVHFENAGGSYVPRQVIDRLTRLFRAAKVQPYGPWGPSRMAGEAMDRSRAVISGAINADPDEIHFGPSTSQNTYVLAQALRPLMRHGDEIIVTNQDHEANIGPWRRLADTGLVIKEWQVDPATGLLELGKLDQLLSERTRLVCCTHCSNIAATINPVARIAELAHDAGALLVIDGVSWAPHAAIDVKALNVDIYLYSLYKTYGPHLGLLYTRRALLEQVANQGHFFNADKPTHRLTPAGPQHAEIGAAEGIVDYYDTLYEYHFGGTDEAPLRKRVQDVHRLMAAQEQALMTPLLELLGQKADVRVIGCQQGDRTLRVPTIAFHSRSKASADIVAALVKGRIGCNHSHFYAYRLVKTLGLDPGDALVRLSMLHYNTLDEVQRACEILDQTL